MNAFESMFGKSRMPKSQESEPAATADDFADNAELYTRLNRLPSELRNIHAERMSNMDDDEALTYIDGILESRESAMRESVVSDETLEPYFHAHEQEIWHDLETKVFTDAQQLGHGQTAKVKKYQLYSEVQEREVPLAIKYLVSPTEKTLSVSGEHDLIREVERVRAIEQAEDAQKESVPHVRVPHPYFYYKNGKTQCYGMELIDGINLQQGIDGEWDEETRAELRTALAGIDRQALLKEFELFFDAMHTVCVHGDMKAGNIMVTREGRFYVIDFGQSMIETDINDKARDQFEVLKDDDRNLARLAVTQFLNVLEG